MSRRTHRSTEDWSNRRSTQRPPEHSASQPKSQHRPSLSATRERLAFAVLALFACICIVQLGLPGRINEQTMILVGSLITLIISYYFYSPRQ